MNPSRMAFDPPELDRDPAYWRAVAMVGGRGSVGKRIVHGLLERGGEVRVKVIPSTEASEIHPIVRQNVANGSAPSCGFFAWRFSTKLDGGHYGRK